jgi:hypothetical protein
MSFKIKNLTRMFAVAILVMGAMVSVPPISDARAETPQSQGAMVSNAKWLAECGACHFAYPPRFLPAESWRAIMSGLDKHFGSNAGLDAASANEITAFLEKNASTTKHKVSSKNEASGKPLLRITETRWFKSEHSEVAARTWKLPKVKSRANCGACHTQAEQGDFNEDNVEIPK